jgi:superfamily II DNA or RNA helicase
MERLHFPTLLPAATLEEYRLHRVALEWDLESPIIINSKEEIASAKHWSEHFTPYEHQVKNLITFCRRAPVALIADDVGLGKTISAGMILSELMTRNRVKRALVMCPKLLLPQWQEELMTHFGIASRHGTGHELDVLLNNSTSVVITTYASARRRFDDIRSARFDMLILDEAHKLRNLHGTQKAPKFALEVRDALENRTFKYVVMLTATPVQNRVWDLYSLVDCLTVAKGHRNPFGTPDQFAARYIADGRSNARVIHPGRKDEFRHVVNQYMVRTRRDDSRLEFPRREVRLDRTPATSEEMELAQLVSENIEDFNPLLQSSVAQAMMSSPEALIAQLRNMAERGTISQEMLEDAESVATRVTVTGKLQRLAIIISKLVTSRRFDWRLLVFTRRKETQRAIAQFLRKRGISYGLIQGGAAGSNARAIKGFWSDPPENHVLVSTDAGAEGVNLQVANFLVNYDLPWNPMIVEQRIGRVQRLASKHDTVTVVNLVVAGSVEEKIVGRLVERLQLVSDTVGDVESILESAGGTLSEDDGFESMIRKLVVKSLVGQDVEAALRKATASMDRGKVIHEENREAVDEHLGKRGGTENSGPLVPELVQPKPSLSVRDFVMRGLTEEGAHMEPTSNGCFRVSRAGRAPELIAFNSEALPNFDYQPFFSRSHPRLYQEGRPDFAKFVQSWIDRAGHCVRDLSEMDDALLDVLASEWVEAIDGAILKNVTIKQERYEFQGTLACRASAAVAHDRFEKLVDIPILPQGHKELETNGSADIPLIQQQIDVAQLGEQIGDRVWESVKRDEDMLKFCTFYNQRRVEEVDRAECTPEKQRVVEESFTPFIAAIGAALDGVRYVVVTLTVEFDIDENGPYSAEIEVVPATRQVLGEPNWDTCELSGQRVPAPCLAACERTATRALRHLLARSDQSDRYVRPEFIVTCDVSGRKLIDDETEVSEVSGRRAWSELFATSEISGRRALVEEMTRCEFTQAMVMTNEFDTSEVSGKRYREDERAESAMSKKSGHRSEFLECQHTGDWVLPEELGKSDLSGLHVRKDLLLQSEKPPARLGIEDEFVKCQATDKRILRDEASQSAVSNKWFDRSLLVSSDNSSRMGHPSEMVVCAVTRARLLPDETEKCCRSGKIVQRELLTQSEISSAWALEQYVTNCERTGKLAIEGELIICELTGQKVIPELIEFCVQSGKRVVRDRLIQSAFSGKFVLPEFASQSIVSSKHCLESEAVRCMWLDGPLLPEESRVCHRTGLPFARKLLDGNGNFRVLMELLDRIEPGEDYSEFLPWIREQRDGAFKSAAKARGAGSPNGSVHAVCCELRYMLGLKTRIVGFLIRDVGEREILGRYTIGRRVGGRWQFIRDEP